MSVYRRHADGVWTRKPDIEKLTRQLQLIPVYDELTDGQFHSEFTELSGRLRRAIEWQKKQEKGSVAAPALRLLLESCPRMQRPPDFTPPIVMVVGRALVPHAFKRRFARLLEESRPT